MASKADAPLHGTGAPGLGSCLQDKAAPAKGEPTHSTPEGLSSCCNKKGSQYDYAPRARAGLQQPLHELQELFHLQLPL